MSNALEMPFEIGQQMWEPIYPPRQVRVTCPVCFGKLAVVVILGNAEHVGVPCDACGSGFDGPRGYLEEWDYAAGARPFVIAGVESMRGGDDWVVRNDSGWTYNFANLCATESEALQKAHAHAEALLARQCDQRVSRRKGVAEKLPWTVRYHRQCIRDLERKLEWHRSRVESRTAHHAVATPSESATAAVAPNS